VHLNIIKDFYQLTDKKIALKEIKIYKLNTLWTGEADLRLYITTVQDG
jgi:hypothetical protein